MNMDRSKIIDNWEEILLDWYGDSNREGKRQTLEEINEEWGDCFMTNLTTSEMTDNWEEILLDWYPDSNREVKKQTLEEVNDEWCKCFMTDLTTKRILAKAA